MILFLKNKIYRINNVYIYTHDVETKRTIEEKKKRNSIFSKVKNLIFRITF